MGFVFVRCTFERSAFSGERVFTIAISSGNQYVGISPLGYCYRGGTQLSAAEPSGDSPIHGELEARLIRNENGNAYVAIPDGEKVLVPATIVVERIQ